MEKDSRNNRSDRSNRNTQSTQNTQSNQLAFLPKHGHYRQLRVYRVAEVIYDVTFYFTHKYLSKGDRTVDQMVQAARSGKQNIAEGNQAATTSAETEIKLTNVAKASLEELLIDYEDYLRVRSLTLWGLDNPRLERLRKYVRTPEFLAEYSSLFTKMNEEEMCNFAITLIHQAIYMLDHLLEHQQERFVTGGGVREQMTKARLDYRSKKH